MPSKKNTYYFLSLCAVVAALAAIFVHMRKKSPIPFIPGSSGTEYRMLERGKTAVEPSERDVILVDLTLSDAEGKSLEDIEEGIPVSRNAFATGQEARDKILHEALGKLSAGDHVQYRVRAADWFGAQLSEACRLYEIKEDAHLLVGLRAQSVMDQEAFARWTVEQKQKAATAASEQLKHDRKIIQDYIKKHSLPAKSTPSGLHYAIDKPGFGARAHQGNTVKVHYTGRLLDGTVFDTSLPDVARRHNLYDPKRNYQPLQFQLGVPGIIEGWQEGIALLHKGARARLLVPSGLAYGTQAVGDKIPANAVLLFEVELVDVVAEKL